MLDTAGSQVHGPLSHADPGCHIDDALGRLRPLCGFAIRIGRAIVGMGVSGPVLKEVVVLRGRWTQEQVAVVRTTLGEVVVQLGAEDRQEENDQRQRGHCLDRHSSKRRPPL